MDALSPILPNERPYMPRCSEAVLSRLAMLPGPGAQAMARYGRGKVPLAPPASAKGPAQNLEQSA